LFFLFSCTEKEFVCGTVPRYDLWLCVNKITGELKYYRKEEPNTPYGIAIFNKATQPSDDTSMITLPFSRPLISTYTTFYLSSFSFNEYLKNKSK